MGGIPAELYKPHKHIQYEFSRKSVFSLHPQSIFLILVYVHIASVSSLWFVDAAACFSVAATSALVSSIQFISQLKKFVQQIFFCYFVLPNLCTLCANLHFCM